MLTLADLRQVLSDICDAAEPARYRTQIGRDQLRETLIVAIGVLQQPFDLGEELDRSRGKIWADSGLLARTFNHLCRSEDEDLEAAADWLAVELRVQARTLLVRLRN